MKRMEFSEFLHSSFLASKTLVFATETYTLPYYLSAKLKLFQNSFHNQSFKNNPFNEF